MTFWYWLVKALHCWPRELGSNEQKMVLLPLMRDTRIDDIVNGLNNGIGRKSAKVHNHEWVTLGAWSVDPIWLKITRRNNLPEIALPGIPEADAVICLSLKHLSRMYLPGDWHAWAKVEAPPARHFARQLGWPITGPCPSYRTPFTRRDERTSDELIEAFFNWAYGGQPAAERVAEAVPASEEIPWWEAEAMLPARGEIRDPVRGQPAAEMAEAVPRVSVPLGGRPAAEMAEAGPLLAPSLPRQILTEDSTRENEKCCICLAFPKSGDVIVRTPCLCVFHEACLQPALRRKSTCPIHIDTELINVREPRVAASNGASRTGEPHVARANGASQTGEPLAFQPVTSRRERSRSSTRRAEIVSSLQARLATATEARNNAQQHFQ